MSDAKRRICYVIPSLDRGGTERQLVNLVAGLSEMYDLRVLCAREAGALASEVGRFCDVQPLRLSSGWDPRAPYRMQEAFEAWGPDLVHSFMFGFDYSVNIAARKVGVSVVVSSRRQLATWKKPRHIRTQKRANRLVDCIVANSRAVAEFASKQEDEPLDKFRVILNGIDGDAYASYAAPAAVAERLSIPEGRKVVGMVANFSPVKDHALFLRCASDLAGRRDDLHFLFVGDGPLRETIEAEIDAAGLTDRFTITTATEGLGGLYGLLSVSVLCSKSEGCPNAVMEAMAAGRPVVAAKVGGIPELIEDGVTGRLIDSRLPSDFADAIASILDDPDEAERLGCAAAISARENLSVDAMIQGYASLYTELFEHAESAVEEA